MYMRMLALAAALLTPAAASAEIWRVSEGPNGAIKGQWNIQISGDAVTGTATMGSGAGPLTYAIVGAVKDGRIAVKRANPSNGKVCDYSARLGAEDFTGAAVCAGEHGPWVVKRGK